MVLDYQTQYHTITYSSNLNVIDGGSNVHLTITNIFETCKKPVYDQISWFCFLDNETIPFDHFFSFNEFLIEGNLTNTIEIPDSFSRFPIIGISDDSSVNITFQTTYLSFLQVTNCNVNIAHLNLSENLRIELLSLNQNSSYNSGSNVWIGLLNYSSFRSIGSLVHVEKVILEISRLSSIFLHDTYYTLTDFDNQTFKLQISDDLLVFHIAIAYQGYSTFNIQSDCINNTQHSILHLHPSGSIQINHGIPYSSIHPPIYVFSSFQVSLDAGLTFVEHRPIEYVFAVGKSNGFNPCSIGVLFPNPFAPCYLNSLLNVSLLYHSINHPYSCIYQVYDNVTIDIGNHTQYANVIIIQGNPDCVVTFYNQRNHYLYLNNLIIDNQINFDLFLSELSYFYLFGYLAFRRPCFFNFFPCTLR